MLEQSNQAEIDFTKKPIQSSRFDADNKFDIKKAVPVDMLNVGHEKKNVGLISMRSSESGFQFSQVKNNGGSMLLRNRLQLIPSRCTSPKQA